MSEIEVFQQRYGKTDFRHKDTLIPSIESGELSLKSHTDEGRVHLPPCRNFLDIYRFRAEHLLRVGTDNALRLREDVLPFCEELEKTPEEPVAIWLFGRLPGYSFAVFEGVTSRRILGCLQFSEEEVGKKAEPSAA